MKCLLICGSRYWNNEAAIERELLTLDRHVLIVIVHGACRGADQQAGLVAKRLGFRVEERPAEWKRYGKIAGRLRNEAMFNEFVPDMVLAFHENITEAKGTKHMLSYAEKNKCPTRLISQ